MALWSSRNRLVNLPELGTLRARGEGFALVEILLVLALVAILAISVGPKFYSSSAAELEAANRRLAADLSYARELSIATGVSHGVQGFRLPQNGYTVYRGSTSTPIADPWTKSNFPVYFSSLGYPSVSWAKLPIVQILFTISFDSRGTPTFSGTNPITIVNGSASRTITVTPTGLVQ